MQICKNRIPDDIMKQEIFKITDAISKKNMKALRKIDKKYCGFYHQDDYTNAIRVAFIYDWYDGVKYLLEECKIKLICDECHLPFTLSCEHGPICEAVTQLKHFNDSRYIKLFVKNGFIIPEKHCGYLVGTYIHSTEITEVFEKNQMLSFNNNTYYSLAYQYLIGACYYGRYRDIDTFFKEFDYKYLQYQNILCEGFIKLFEGNFLFHNKIKLSTDIIQLTCKPCIMYEKKDKNIKKDSVIFDEEHFLSLSKENHINLSIIDNFFNRLILISRDKIEKTLNKSLYYACKKENILAIEYLFKIYHIFFIKHTISFDMLYMRNYEIFIRNGMNGACSNGSIINGEPNIIVDIMIKKGGIMQNSLHYSINEKYYNLTEETLKEVNNFSTLSNVDKNYNKCCCAAIVAENKTYVNKLMKNMDEIMSNKEIVIDTMFYIIKGAYLANNIKIINKIFSRKKCSTYDTINNYLVEAFPYACSSKKSNTSTIKYILDYISKKCEYRDDIIKKCFDNACKAGKLSAVKLFTQYKPFFTFSLTMAYTHSKFKIVKYLIDNRICDLYLQQLNTDKLFQLYHIGANLNICHISKDIIEIIKKRYLMITTEIKKYIPLEVNNIIITYF